jgi:hypothetical protein
MKFAAEIGSDVMIYIPSFIKIGPGIQKLRGMGHIDNTQTGWRSLRVLSFFETKEVG